MSIYRQKQEEIDRIVVFLESLSDEATEELRVTLNEGRRKSDQQADEMKSDALKGALAASAPLETDQSTFSQTLGGPKRYKRREIENALLSAWTNDPPGGAFNRGDAYDMLAAAGFQFKGPDKGFTLRAISRTLTAMSKGGVLEQLRPSAGSNPAVYQLAF